MGGSQSPAPKVIPQTKLFVVAWAVYGLLESAKTKKTGVDVVKIKIVKTMLFEIFFIFFFSSSLIFSFYIL